MCCVVYEVSRFTYCLRQKFNWYICSDILNTDNMCNYRILNPYIVYAHSANIDTAINSPIAWWVNRPYVVEGELLEKVRASKSGLPGCLGWLQVALSWFELMFVFLASGTWERLVSRSCVGWYYKCTKQSANLVDYLAHLKKDQFYAFVCVLAGSLLDW